MLFDDPGPASTAKQVCDDGNGRHDFIRARGVYCYFDRLCHGSAVALLAKNTHNEVPVRLTSNTHRMKVREVKTLL